MGRWQRNIVDDDIQDGETLDNLEALSMTDEVYAKVAAFVDKYYEREKDEYALPAAQINWIVCLIIGYMWRKIEQTQHCNSHKAIRSAGLIR